MTGARVRAGRPPRAHSPAAPLLFAGDGHEPRRRRVADAVLLGVAVTALVMAALAASAVEGDESELVDALDRLTH